MAKEYILKIIDRKTLEVVHTEKRKSEQSFNRLWCLALSSVNPLQYKMVATEENIIL